MARRILIIEDEPDIREVLSMSLELAMDWSVQTAASGAEGIEQAAATSPEAIVLDVMMPDMDGVETFRGLRARPETRSIPVVLLTAKVQPQDRARFAELGVAGVLAKPFDPLTVGAEIAGILGW